MNCKNVNLLYEIHHNLPLFFLYYSTFFSSRLVKNFATGKDDKKRAYEMLLNSGLAQGKVHKNNRNFFCFFLKKDITVGFQTKDK